MFAAMTMKLQTISTHMINFNDSNRHIEDTCCSQLASTPLLLVTLNGGMHGIRKSSDDRDCPSVTRQDALLVSPDELFDGQERDNNGEGGIEPCEGAVF